MGRALRRRSPSRRRSGSRFAAPLRAGVLAAALVLLALGATARGADDDPGVAVVIHTRDGDRTLTGDELKASYDIFSQPYTVRAPDGTEDTPRTQFSGASISRVLEDAGLVPSEVSFVETRRADRSVIDLDATDISGAPFADGPPIVFRDGPSTRFLRPVRNGTDVNASDNLASQDGEPLELTARTGKLLDVSAITDLTEVDAGDPIRLTATVANAAPGAKVAVDWDFGDGSTGDGASVEHRFASRGTYRAIAHAVGDDDSSGASGFVTIVVGDPSTGSPDGGGGPTGGGPEGNPGGGGHGGGHGNGNPSNSSPTLGTGSITRGTGAGDGGGDPAPGTATTPGSPYAPGVVPTSSRTGDGAGGSEGGDDTQSQPGGNDPADVLVSGRLLSATAAPPEGSTPGDSAAAPVEQPESKANRDLMIAGGLLLLLGLGGGRELRGVSRIGASS